MTHGPDVIGGGVAREDAPVDAPAAAAAEGIGALGHDLLASTPGLRAEGNVVVSASSLATAFAMLRTGARGATADEIDAVMHFPRAGLGGAYNALTRHWADAGTGDGRTAPELAVANAVWAQRGLRLEAAFLDTLSRDFGAGVRAVDFANPEASEQINAWVRAQTRDRIQELFAALDPATRMVLANAIYLRARWDLPFEPHDTFAAAFTTAGGDQAPVQTMHRTGSMGFASSEGWQAVRLGYRGGQLSMWVLVPTGPADPVRLLDPAVLADAARRQRPAIVRLALPKWEFQNTMDLIGPLAGLGMEVALGPGADYSAMSAAGLGIAEVVQCADITVDELGTEAAAVTGIVMPASAPARPAADVVVTADHPFAFAVLHDASGTPLFEGIVGNPAGTR